MDEELPLIMADPHWVDGIPFPGFIREDTIRKIPDIPVYNDDIYVTGYPKSGHYYYNYNYYYNTCF